MAAMVLDDDNVTIAKAQSIDEGLLNVYYLDYDEDGFGTETQIRLACSVPDGYVADHTDCNDGNNAIHPDIADPCGDGIDQDCDPEACSIQLPDLIGLTQAQAQTTIADIEMTIGTVTQECSDTIPYGSVIGHTPTIGATVVYGDAIDLVISDGLCDVENSIGMHLKFIPPGTFTMGSPKDEPGRGSNEMQHEVTLTSFYIQTTEVTQRQWETVIGEGTNPSYYAECGDGCPVDTVTWYDSVIFCNRLSQLEGLTPIYYLECI